MDHNTGPDLSNVRPGDDRQRPDRRLPGGGRTPTGREVQAYRVSMSWRVWAAFAALALMLLAAIAGMVLARGQLDGVKAALHRAETRAADAEGKLEDALAEKGRLTKELKEKDSVAQKSAEGEKSLAAARKRADDLAGEVKSLKARLAQTKKAQGDTDKLRTELEAVKSKLGVTLVNLAEAQAEVQRLRAGTQSFNRPYSPPPGQPPYGQDQPYGQNPRPYSPPWR